MMKERTNERKGGTFFCVDHFWTKLFCVLLDLREHTIGRKRQHAQRTRARRHARYNDDDDDDDFHIDFFYIDLF